MKEKDIIIEYSNNFKEFLEYCKKVFSIINKIKMTEYKELLQPMEKYKLLFIYKHFFIDFPDKKVSLPTYKIQDYISFYKQKALDVTSVSNLPLLTNYKQIIYYFYIDNSIKDNINLQSEIIDLKENKKNRYSKGFNRALIKELLLTPTENISFELEILEEYLEHDFSLLSQENNQQDNNDIQNQRKLKCRDKEKNIIKYLSKILFFKDDEFINVIKKYYLFNELKKNISKEYKSIKINRLNYEGEFKYNEDVLYEIIIWVCIVDKYNIDDKSYLNTQIFNETLQRIDEIFNVDEKNLKKLIKKTKKEIDSINSLFTVSHTVS